jgi:hypothetical protein
MIKTAIAAAVLVAAALTPIGTDAIAAASPSVPAPNRMDSAACTRILDMIQVDVQTGAKDSSRLRELYNRECR